MTVNRPGVTVRHRKGYRLGNSPAAPKNKEPLVALSAGVLPRSALPLRMFATPVGVLGKTARVAVAVEVRAPRVAVGRGRRTRARLAQRHHPRRRSREEEGDAACEIVRPTLRFRNRVCHLGEMCCIDWQWPSTCRQGSISCERQSQAVVCRRPAASTRPSTCRPRQSEMSRCRSRGWPATGARARFARRPRADSHSPGVRQSLQPGRHAACRLLDCA